jgi:hypothetical protein
MNRWKAVAIALTLSAALTGAAYAQPQDWSHDQRAADNDRRDRDHDRDRDRDHDRDHRRGDDNRWRDRDRDHDYRNGSYAYGNDNGRYSNGNGRFGRNNQASQIGYQDGLAYGRRDASSGKGFNATGSQNYDNADRGYSSSFGDKNQYRQEYRQAYEQGYRAGYQRY